ncbi:MAG TPA: hypothetical protein VIU11_06700 [Nakamurella sp.]
MRDRSAQLTRALLGIAATTALAVMLGGCAGVAGTPLAAAGATVARTTSAPPPTPETISATTTVTESAPPPVTRTQTTTATATATASPATPDREATSESTSEPHYYTETQIRAEVTQAFDVVNQYWVDLFGTWQDKQGNPIQWWTPQLYNGDGFYDSTTGRVPDCGGQPVDSGPNAGFCGSALAGTGTLSWDMQLFRMGGGVGDGAFYVTVAHEFGHAAQARFQHDAEGAAVPADVGPAVELQADCLAGATLSKAAQDGYLQIEAGDLDEIASFLASMSDNVGSHGTADQRIGSFHQGYDGDIESCLLQRQHQS